MIVILHAHVKRGYAIGMYACPAIGHLPIRNPDPVKLVS